MDEAVWSQTILLYQSRKLAVALIYTQYESMFVRPRRSYDWEWPGLGEGGGGGRMEGRLLLPGLPLRQAGIQIVLNFLRKI